MWNILFIFNQSKKVSHDTCFQHFRTILKSFWTHFMFYFSGKPSPSNISFLQSHRFLVFVSLLGGVVVWISYRAFLTSELYPRSFQKRFTGPGKKACHCFHKKIQRMKLRSQDFPSCHLKLLTKHAFQNLSPTSLTWLLTWPLLWPRRPRAQDSTNRCESAAGRLLDVRWTSTGRLLRIVPGFRHP